MTRIKGASIWVTATLFAGLGCAPIPSKPAATPQQLAYLASIGQEPLEFEVTKDKAAEIWGRAQSFIGQYSSMKIQVATEFVLQTFNPISGQNVYTTTYGYSVTKTPLAETVRISVECSHGGFVNMFHSDKEDAALALQNAHILTHYLRTAELPYPGLISR